jgi:hypothetical protein
MRTAAEPTQGQMTADLAPLKVDGVYYYYHFGTGASAGLFEVRYREPARPGVVGNRDAYFVDRRSGQVLLLQAGRASLTRKGAVNAARRDAKLSLIEQQASLAVAEDEAASARKWIATHLAQLDEANNTLRELEANEPKKSFKPIEPGWYWGRVAGAKVDWYPLYVSWSSGKSNTPLVVKSSINASDPFPLDAYEWLSEVQQPEANKENPVETS